MDKQSISALFAAKSRELLQWSLKIKEIYATSTTKLRSNAKKWLSQKFNPPIWNPQETINPNAPKKDIPFISMMTTWALLRYQLHFQMS